MKIENNAQGRTAAEEKLIEVLKNVKMMKTDEEKKAEAMNFKKSSNKTYVNIDNN